MRCRPGDLAVVITAPGEFNSGLIVEVLRQSDGSPWGYDYGWNGPTWWVRCGVLLTWWDGAADVEVRAWEGPLPDNVLHPIRGKPAATAELAEVADAAD